MKPFLVQASKILDSGGILEGDDVIGRSADPLSMVATLAQAILRPRTTSELIELVRLANELNQPIVVHGGRTGVSGGAYTLAEDVVISLERMNAIEDVDPVNHTIVAQAGVTLQQLQEAAAEHGMYYPVDLGARGTATVGGMLATNAGGNRTLRWGMTRDRVLGLEVVIADGSLVSSMHRLIKNNSGYDLKQMFIGAEGTLGIITRAVFRLVPALSTHDVALIAAPDYESVLQILKKAQSLASLSAFELMYESYYAAVARNREVSPPLPPTYPYYVLVESMGYHPDRDKEIFESFLGELLETSVAEDIILAQSDAQRNALWSVREAVEAAVRDIAPCLVYDVSLEVTDIDDYVSCLNEALKPHEDAKLIVNGHIGDNNIHLGVSLGPTTLSRKSEIDALVYKPLAIFHGSMSAEHGIGTTKNGYLHFTRSEEEIALMRRIKACLDPRHILNPRVLFESGSL